MSVHATAAARPRRRRRSTGSTGDGERVSDEARLIQRVCSGERNAFVELVERYQGLVSHVVGRMVSDPRDREELCQDVFLEVHGGLEGFRGESKLSTWIGRIAYRVCLNHLERRTPPVPASQVEPAGTDDGRESWLAGVAGSRRDPHREAVRGELREFLHREIEALRPQYRAAVTLYHVEDMTVGEVASVMELPVGTVKSHLHRARSELKERLLERYEPEDVL